MDEVVDGVDEMSVVRVEISAALVEESDVVLSVFSVVEVEVEEVEDVEEVEEVEEGEEAMELEVEGVGDDVEGVEDFAAVAADVEIGDGTFLEVGDGVYVNTGDGTFVDAGDGTPKSNPAAVPVVPEPELEAGEGAGTLVDVPSVIPVLDSAGLDDDGVLDPLVVPVSA